MRQDSHVESQEKGIPGNGKRDLKHPEAGCTKVEAEQEVCVTGTQ